MNALRWIVPMTGMLMLTVASANANEANIKKALQARLGEEAPIESVIKTPYAGLYEVKVGSEIIYTDAEGRYVFVGRILDAETSRDITQARLDELNKIKFADLPLELATKTVRGNGKRVIAVFEDPNCGFCKRFRKTLADAKDVTVYTFMYPILGDDSKTKVKNLWCAADRAKAWDDWMLNSKLPPAAPESCSTASVDKVVELGKKLGVKGTPTVFFTDGTRVAGAMDPKALEARLGSVK